MIDQKLCKELRKKMEAALKWIGDEMDIDIDVGNMRYSDSEVSISITARAHEINGIPIEQYEFEKFCALYGFEPEDYKKRFKTNGDTYVLIGFNPNKPTFAFKIMREFDGEIHNMEDSESSRKTIKKGIQ